MKIKIKFMSADSIEIDFNGVTVIDLKKIISEKKLIDIERIKLIYAGKILIDSNTLESYKINDDCTVHSVIKKIQENNETTVPLGSNINSQTSNFQNNTTPNLESNPTNMYANNPQMQQMMVNMIQNPQMREMLVNMTLQRMNLPLDSPMREIYEQMFSNMFSDQNGFMNMMNTFNSMGQNMGGVQNIMNLFNNVNSSDSTNVNMQNMMNMMSTMNINSNNNLNQSSFEPEASNDTSNMSNIESEPSNIEPEASNDTSNMSNIEHDISNIEPGPSNDTSNMSNIEPDESQIPTTQQSISNENAKIKYANEIEQIKMMGFEDENKILQTLLQSCGSVSIALNKLLN